MTITLGGLQIDWLGYATVRLQANDSPVVYLDPGRYGVLTGDWPGDVPHPNPGPIAPRDGNVVFVTHDHHYQDDGVRRVAAEDASVVVYDNVDAARINDRGEREVCPPEDLPYDVERVAMGETLAVGDARFEAIPAYNEPNGRNTREDGSPIHPEGFGCGVIVTLEGRRCCWPGDTDLIAEHEGIDASVLLPSIAQNITMNRHEAATLARQVRPDLVVPIHYNTFPDLRADSRAFAGDVAAAGIPVALDED